MSLPRDSSGRKIWSDSYKQTSGRSVSQVPENRSEKYSLIGISKVVRKEIIVVCERNVMSDQIWASF